MLKLAHSLGLDELNHSLAQVLDTGSRGIVLVLFMYRGEGMQPLQNPRIVQDRFLRLTSIFPADQAILIF